MSRAQEFMEMAEDAVSDARMVKGKSNRLLWNSHYYAVFYGAEAALLSIGEQGRSHLGTDRQVGKILYKERNLIDSDTASFYSNIRRIREEIDYQPVVNINNDPDESLDRVVEILEKFENTIERDGE